MGEKKITQLDFLFILIIRKILFYMGHNNLLDNEVALKFF